MKELIDCTKCKYKGINVETPYHECKKHDKILLKSNITNFIIPTDKCNGEDFECVLV